MTDPETEAYFTVVHSDDGFLISTDMDTEELEVIQDILRGMIEVRLTDEPPTIH